MIRNNDYLKGNKFAVGAKPNKTAFVKRHIPWNKNKKGIHLSPMTEFKKGQRGINWMPLGSLTIRTDKSGAQRQYIKIAEPNIWIEYAKFIWIKNNGKIPKGFLIHHIDRNTLNDRIKNLASLTRKAHFEIHKIGEIGRQALMKKRIEAIKTAP